MNPVYVFLLAFGLGGLVGLTITTSVFVRQVQSGRIVISGRIYFCRDTGPVAR